MLLLKFMLVTRGHSAACRCSSISCSTYGRRGTPSLSTCQPLSVQTLLRQSLTKLCFLAYQSCSRRQCALLGNMNTTSDTMANTLMSEIACIAKTPPQ